MSIASTCKHFVSIQTECEVGIHPRSLGGTENAGWVRRIPCITTTSLPRLEGGCACDHYVPETPEEREAKFAPVRKVADALDRLPLAEVKTMAADPVAYEAWVRKVLA